MTLHTYPQSSPQSRRGRPAFGRVHYGALFAVLAIACLASAQTSAQDLGENVSVYGTTDTAGVDQGLILLDPAVGSVFDLYVDPGDMASTARDACNECSQCEGSCSACNYCDDGETDPVFGTPCLASPDGGNGDELCAIDVEILLAGDIRIASFTPNPTLCSSTVNAASFPTSFDSDSQNLRFNMLCGLNAMPAELSRLGSLGVEVGELDETDIVTVSVAGQMAIGSNRQQRGIPTELVAAPEPGFAIALLCGGASISLVCRRRARRSHGA